MRGKDIKRIEALSDAVFALAVTLLIVSLEVPRNYAELTQTIRGFYAFGISFLFLMLIWYEQSVFFRRYNLDDPFIVALNGMLIFVVLFYVYPLKFLFTFLFSNEIFGKGSGYTLNAFQWRNLMLIYSIGYIGIYLLFFLMYAHALTKKKQLDLNSIEEFDTRTRMFSTVVLISIGVLSVLAALILPVNQITFSGIIYAFIGPCLTIFYFYRFHRRRLFHSGNGVRPKE
jgi:uncharacterized membrane protein